MNMQTAAIVGGAALVLSVLAGLLGGVPLLDIVLRALVWGGVGFGASLGVETLLRSMVPELFEAAAGPGSEAAEPADAAEVPRSVDITLDDDLEAAPASFVEEDENAGGAGEPAPAGVRAPAAPAVPAAAADDEEMPEIGSFLDAFKPGSPEGAEAVSAADYVEADGSSAEGLSAGPSAPAGEVTIDGEAQDPAILAKAVQTVMKRDSQGS